MIGDEVRLHRLEDLRRAHLVVGVRHLREPLVEGGVLRPVQALVLVAVVVRDGRAPPAVQGPADPRLVAELLPQGHVPVRVHVHVARVVQLELLRVRHLFVLLHRGLGLGAHLLPARLLPGGPLRVRQALVLDGLGDLDEPLVHAAELEEALHALDVQASLVDAVDRDHVLVDVDLQRLHLFGLAAPRVRVTPRPRALALGRQPRRDNAAATVGRHHSHYPFMPWAGPQQRRRQARKQFLH